MPSYTNPKTGKKIHSDAPLSDEQLEEAFGSAPSVPDDPAKFDSGVNLGSTKDTILAPFKQFLKLPGQAMDVLSDLSPMEALNPIGKVGEGIALSMKDRASKWLEDIPEETQNPHDEIPGSDILGDLTRYGGAALSAIPVLGDFMESGRKMMLRPGQEGQQGAGEMLGHVLTAGMGPYAPEAGKELLTNASKTLHNPTVQGMTKFGAGAALGHPYVGAGYALGGKSIARRFMHGFDPIGNVMDKGASGLQKLSNALPEQPDYANLFKLGTEPPTEFKGRTLVPDVPYSDPIRQLPAGRVPSKLRQEPVEGVVDELGDISDQFPELYQETKPLDDIVDADYITNEAGNKVAKPGQELTPSSDHPLPDNRELIDRILEPNPKKKIEPGPLPEGVEAQRLNASGDLEPLGEVEKVTRMAKYEADRLKAFEDRHNNRPLPSNWSENGKYHAIQLDPENGVEGGYAIFGQKGQVGETVYPDLASAKAAMNKIGSNVPGEADAIRNKALESGMVPAEVPPTPPAKPERPTGITPRALGTNPRQVLADLRNDYNKALARNDSKAAEGILAKAQGLADRSPRAFTKNFGDIDNTRSSEAKLASITGGMKEKVDKITGGTGGGKANTPSFSEMKALVGKEGSIDSGGFNIPVSIDDVKVVYGDTRYHVTPKSGGNGKWVSSWRFKHKD